MTKITKDDFLKVVRHQYLEVLTEDQFKKNANIVQNILRKSLTSELTDIEKSLGNQLVDDIGSFTKWEVIREDFSKAIVYTRRQQVEWEGAERGEFGEIIKARGGVYKDTPENRKAGRVGQKYGEVSKEEKEDIKGLREHSKKIGENIEKREKIKVGQTIKFKTWENNKEVEKEGEVYSTEGGIHVKYSGGNLVVKPEKIISENIEKKKKKEVEGWQSRLDKLGLGDNKQAVDYVKSLMRSGWPVHHAVSMVNKKYGKKN
jgi:hypothetical protein